MEKCAKSVADHSAYNEAYQKAVDWLSGTEEQLNTRTSSKWDSLEMVTQQLNVIKVQLYSSVFIDICKVHDCVSTGTALLLVSLSSAANYQGILAIIFYDCR